MNPVSPVIPDKEYPEVIVAEHQEEYNNLPGVYLSKGNILLTRWELDEKEKQQVQENGFMYLYLFTFGKAITPVILATELVEYENNQMLRDVHEVTHMSRSTLLKVISDQVEKERRRCADIVMNFDYPFMPMDEKQESINHLVELINSPQIS